MLNIKKIIINIKKNTNLHDHKINCNWAVSEWQLDCKWVVVELRESFTNYSPNKRRSCNWVVSHLRITEFYAIYGETNSPQV